MKCNIFQPCFSVLRTLFRFDVTPFLRDHPGGPFVFTDNAAEDLSMSCKNIAIKVIRSLLPVNAAQHSKAAEEEMIRFRIGKVKKKMPYFIHF